MNGKSCGPNVINCNRSNEILRFFNKILQVMCNIKFFVRRELLFPLNSKKKRRHLRKQNSYKRGRRPEAAAPLYLFIINFLRDLLLGPPGGNPPAHAGHSRCHHLHHLAILGVCPEEGPRFHHLHHLNAGASTPGNSLGHPPVPSWGTGPARVW